MALLDLQAMTSDEVREGIAHKSAASKQCASALSLLLCGG